MSDKDSQLPAEHCTVAVIMIHVLFVYCFLNCSVICVSEKKKNYENREDLAY